MALLAVLLSYNFDFECLTDRDAHACQEVVRELGGECVQPSLVTPAPVAVLTTYTRITAPPPSVVLVEDIALFVEPPLLSVYFGPPLGFRAPPGLS